MDGILHLSNHKLTYFSGNYEQFDSERRAILNQQQSIKKKQDAQRLHIQSFVERFRAKASKAKQAQSRIKILEKMRPINALVENAVTKFSFPTPAELRPPLVVINKGKVGYNGKIVLNRLSLRIDAEDRIALLGANGEGKSTLSKLLANKLTLMSGEYFSTNKLRIGYFAQHQLEELSEKDSAYKHIMNLQPGMTEIELRNRLGAAGFKNDIVDLPVENLSGGQKARLLLLISTINAPHILILDEPTNHLDIESREALIFALNDYRGAVIIVSHDSYLVETVADKFWLINNGEVSEFFGNMDDYKNFVTAGKRQGKKISESAKESLLTHNSTNVKINKSISRDQQKIIKNKIFQLRKRLRETEKQIEILETEKKEIENRMSDQSYYKKTPNKEIALTSKKLMKIKSELEILENNWLQISENIEQVS